MLSVATWMDLEIVILSEVSQKEKDNYRMLSLICCAMLSRSVMSDSLQPHELYPTMLLCPWDSPGKNNGVDYHFLLQGIFPTQGSNPDLPHCRQTLYRLSHQEVQLVHIYIFFLYTSLYQLFWLAKSENLRIQKKQEVCLSASLGIKIFLSLSKSLHLRGNSWVL